MTSTINQVDQIIALLSEANSAYLGEPVTQLEHALQTAWFAARAEAGEDVVVAALLHDVGHLIEQQDGLGHPEHDRIGADWLAGLGVSPRVCELIGGHVQAKRYLTATTPSYYANLSETSRMTLAQQGGPMKAAEIVEFRADPRFNDKLRLRVWDEQAKQPGLPVPPLENYRIMLVRAIAGPGPA